MAAQPITLDDFFGQTAPLELVNLAAQLGTAHTDQADSVWAGEEYGSTLPTLLSRPANPIALQVELQRSLTVVHLDGVVEVDQSGILALLPELSTEIVVDRGGVTVVA